MKHLISLFVGVVFLFSFQLNAFGDDNCKIGVFSMQKIQQTSSAFQKLSKSYEKKLEPLKNELEQLQAGLMALREELQKQGGMLNQQAKMDKAKQMGKKERQLEYLMNEFRQETKVAEMEIKRSLFGDLMKVSEELSKKEGYTIIFEKGSGGLLYSSDSVDITDKISNAYDQMHL